MDEKGEEMRAENAGIELAKAIIEMVHLMYQKRTALYFLEKLIEHLQKELDRRRKDILDHWEIPEAERTKI